jgi:hypothetical protein
MCIIGTAALLCHEPLVLDQKRPGAREYYEQLMRSSPKSRLAFMAMKYNDAEPDAFFRDYPKPAVAAVGFDLRRNDEAPEAGLIDNRMRVQIRARRFVVCDLSAAQPAVAPR